ncbi:SMP-30/Gluconolaconase/LRE domain protein [Endogone sp. FLAS-F59071]|nr:SMP-30/Gluconolaconase/LRE domain protein [Endogone sp. FLAS-F59071]|eukprot:RUS14077.1 SMP-30/Gluconolaconase/LRE domain protein [Endogone sp. FLAS-F59071]
MRSPVKFSLMSTKYRVEHFYNPNDALGEGPLWDIATSTLYWIDITRGAFHRLHRPTGKHERIEIGEKIGVLALREKGGLVMAVKNGFAFWHEGKEGKDRLEYVASPYGLDHPYFRMNDGAVDCKAQSRIYPGRFWAGSMVDNDSGYDPAETPGTLYRLDPDGSVYEMVQGVATTNGELKLVCFGGLISTGLVSKILRLSFRPLIPSSGPNTGVVWSPDNKTMYVGDSPTKKIFAWDFDAETGNISNRRVFFDVAKYWPEAFPDGAAVDEEGCLWWALWDGEKIIRIAPSGDILAEIPIPALRPTAPAFFGDNYDEIVITSAGEGVKDTHPLSGDLFRVSKVGVRGMKKYLFQG